MSSPTRCEQPSSFHLPPEDWPRCRTASKSWELRDHGTSVRFSYPCSCQTVPRGRGVAPGADGIGLGGSLIRQGEVDGALAGGSDATLCELGVAAFDRVGAVSRRDPAQGTPQPFDKERDGLVMGEGAGGVLLESLTHARRRGAQILAELAGYAATGDAHHVTAPAEDGAGGAEAIRRALASGGLTAAEVDYVNAHGTGTPLNDASETRALKAAFGGEA